MADIRINSLPEELSPVAGEAVAIDGATTRKTTIEKLVAAGRPLASQAEAEAGTQATKAMTPLTTAQAIAALGASAEQGSKADSALQPGDAATPDQGALADSAVQPGDLSTVATSGEYDDLAGKPTLGSAAAADTADFAAAALAPAISADTMLVDNAAGTAREAKGLDFVRDLLGVDRPKRAKKIKFLVTADWQARPEEAAEIAAQRAMMDDIEANHSDTDWALLLGDLVDRASDDTTGAAPSYGYAELFADMRSRIPSIPLQRWLPLAGNHDRDGTGSGSWKYAWTYNTYKKEVGPLWYYVDYGNLRFVFMSDMAGSNSGEILDVAVAWFTSLMANSKHMNVFVCVHQPPDPTVYTPATDPLASAFQRDPTRITNIINANDNVVACFYGHVGGSLTNATLVTTAYGCPWINVQMGIPTAAINSFDLIYSTMEAAYGATTIDLQRWNATTHANYGSPVSISLKYPVQLSGDTLDFDGRHEVDPRLPVFYGPITSYQSLADFRSDISPFSVASDAVLIAQKIIVGDDSNNNVGGQCVATGYYVPGAADADVDADGYPVLATPAYGLGGAVGFTRTEAGDTNYEAAFTALNTTSAGALEVGFRCYPSTDNRKGLRVYSGDFAMSDTDLDPTVNDSVVGFQVIKSNGQVNLAATNTAFRIARKIAGNGNAIAFYHQGTVSGTISVNGAATAYNTSSDKTWKDDLGELTFDQARSIMNLIELHKFRWNEKAGAGAGVETMGVFAQDLYEVYPDAVTKGGWFSVASGEPWVRNSKKGAEYRPWAVDYSKLIPVMARCIQGMIARQEEIDARLAALER